MNLYESSVTPTPGCGENWKQLNDQQRLEHVEAVLHTGKNFRQLLEITEVRIDGQIVVSFLEPVGADQRGGILLDLEANLKDQVDIGLTVWLEPLGDKSVLRKLRGIEVK